MTRSHIGITMPDGPARYVCCHSSKLLMRE